MWNDKAAEAMEAYKKEVEEYNKTVAETTKGEEEEKAWEKEFIS